jgi:hypothetical protein
MALDRALARVAVVPERPVVVPGQCEVRREGRRDLRRPRPVRGLEPLADALVELPAIARRHRVVQHVEVQRMAERVAR